MMSYERARKAKVKGTYSGMSSNAFVEFWREIKRFRSASKLERRSSSLRTAFPPSPAPTLSAERISPNDDRSILRLSDGNQSETRKREKRERESEREKRR
jgi:hypothetical protein